jgi:hypothetical protein
MKLSRFKPNDPIRVDYTLASESILTGLKGVHPNESKNTWRLEIAPIKPKSAYPSGTALPNADWLKPAQTGFVCIAPDF